MTSAIVSYQHPLTESSREDVTYVVHTLAHKKMSTLIKLQGDLDQARIRLDEVHPLRFMEAVFQNKQNCIDLSDLKKRIIIWKPFWSGLKDNLKAQDKKGNLSQKDLEQFSKNIGIQFSEIHGYAEQKNWDSMMELLMKYKCK
ncbi:MAG: hypothetical protein CMO81_02530 [Waddliaceae bacterium]|nr:hypothetical protein [Waddliaceae bacterium]